jgi:stearoyl-CoA desaturase (delta-9 desaturase)
VPFRILYQHDIRDWAQRHPACHAFFIHQNPMWKDFLWQLHCEIRLAHPPRFQIESVVVDDRFHRFLQRTWMLQQLPWAILCLRVGWNSLRRLGRERAGDGLAHRALARRILRAQHRRARLAPSTATPSRATTFPGSASSPWANPWHNNHHAFPGSARLDCHPRNPIPAGGHCERCGALGLAWHIKLPADLPIRPELVALKVSTSRPVNLIDRALLARGGPT